MTKTINILFLASEGCPVTGRIYNAGVGYYGRAAVMTSPGTIIGDGKKIPTLEEVGAAWEKIQSLTGAREYGQLGDLMGDMLAAFSPKPEKAATAAATVPTTAGATAGPAAGGPGITSVAAVFEKMPQAFRAEKAAGVKPASFRAPRLWGSTAMVNALEKLGYKADASYPLYFYRKRLFPYHPSRKNWLRKT